MNLYYAIIVSVAVLLAGCSDITEGSDQNMRSWFERGTELTLPPSAKFIAGKNNSLYLSDIYLKLQVPTSYKENLENELNAMKEAPAFELPETMAAWPHWDLAGRNLVFYEKTTGSPERGGFISHIAFEEATGFMFCHFVEYAP